MIAIDPGFERGLRLTFTIAAWARDLKLWDEAKRSWERVDRTPVEPVDLALRAMIAGDNGEADRQIHHLEDLARQHYFSPMVMARAYAMHGETDRAISILEEIAATHSSDSIIGLETDPFFDPLRKSARFEALLRRLGATEPAVVRADAERRFPMGR